MLLLEPLLVTLAVCFGSLSSWNTHPRAIFNDLALTVHAPVHRPFDAVQLSFPLSRKTPPKHVSTSVKMVFLGSQAAFLFLQTRLSWVKLMPKSWIFVSSDHNTFTQFSSESLANFRRACTCAFLSTGPCGQFRISVLYGVMCNHQLFSWWLCCPSCLEIIDKIIPCSSGLIPHRSHDQWYSTRWDLAWSPRPREIWQLLCVSSICE